MHTQQLRKRIILWEDQLEDLKTTGSASDFSSYEVKSTLHEKTFPNTSSHSFASTRTSARNKEYSIG